MRSHPVQVIDSQTGVCRLSNNLEVVIREINIWKRIDGKRENGTRNYNVVKIFELIDDIDEA